MKKLQYTLLLLIVFCEAFSQNYNHMNWWCGANIHFPNGGGAPTWYIGNALSTSEGLAIISDKQGNLQFYSNGVSTWDASNTLMPTQTGLRYKQGLVHSSPQGVNILCDPGNCKQYYLFTTDCGVAQNDSLFYSKVDMTLPGNGTAANPRGDIVAGAKNIYLTKNRTEMFTAIHHANKIDWWIITTSPNSFEVHLLTAAGINPVPVYSGNGGTPVTFANSMGALKGSPDGTKLLVADNGLIYDFNNSTGVISNQINLGGVGGANGAEFSPNSKVVYFNSYDQAIYQFDLSLPAASIPASKLNVGTPVSAITGSMQLGPDRKIYNSHFGANTLGCINNPDIVGLGCNFVSNALFFPGSTWDLPQFFEPAPIAASFTATPGCLGDPITFTNTSLYYTTSTWWFGDPASGGNDTSYIQHPSHIYSAPGTYTVTLIASQSCHCEVDTFSQIITIAPTLTLTATSTSAPCNGGTGNASITVAGGTSSYTYSWSLSGGTSSAANGLAAGNYTVTVTDAIGCTKNATVTITQPAVLTSTIVATNPNCNGGTGNASITAGGGTPNYTYAWSSGAGSSSAAIGLSAGNYSVVISDANGCTSTQTISITEPPVITSSQSPIICTGSGYILPGGTAVSAGGIYKDTLTSVNGCDSIITTTLTVTSILTFSQSVNICTGSPYTLPGGAVVSTAGVYKDTLTSAGGCDSIITTTLTIIPAINVAQSVSICLGQTYTLPGGAPVSTAGIYKDTLTSAGGCDSIITTTVTITSAITSNQAASICTGSTYILPGGTVVSTAGIYKDTLTCAGGCDSIVTITLTIISPITSNQTASVCTGSTYTLPGGIVVSAAGIYKDTLTSSAGCDSIITTTLTVVSASNVSQPVSICNGQTYTLPGGIVVSAAGIYKDTLTSSAGCDSIITTSLTINALPAATVSPDITITQGTAINLTAGGGGTYQWSSSETTQSINVSPVQTTIYCVTVTDANGCTNKACVTVTLEPIDCSQAQKLYLPNVFSPNADTENDRFCLMGAIEECIKSLTINIYDRWGEKVYESTDKNFCWEGAYDNNLNSAVFVYYLDVIFVNGDKLIKKGNVSLIK